MRLLPPLHHRRIVGHQCQDVQGIKGPVKECEGDDVKKSSKCELSKIIAAFSEESMEEQLVSLQRVSETAGGSDFSDEAYFGMEDVFVEVEVPSDKVHVVASVKRSEKSLAQNAHETNGMRKEHVIYEQLFRDISQGTAKCVLGPELGIMPTSKAVLEEGRIHTSGAHQSKACMSEEVGDDNIEDDVEEPMLSGREDDDCENEYSGLNEIPEDLEDESIENGDPQVASKAYQKGFSPPDMYLPLPTPPPNSEKKVQCTASVPRLDYHGTDNKHLLPAALSLELVLQKEAIENARSEAYAIYSRLPATHNGPPVITRLRRRLIRLVAHATLSHHRGKHEVIFQTVFLFDAIIIKYVHWVYSRIPSDSCPDPLVIRSANSLSIKSSSKSTSQNAESSISLTSFFASSGFSVGGDRRKSSPTIARNYEDISRLSTTTSTNSAQLPIIEPISKEELRSVMIACLLLASKWNNSRYLPPAILCSPPVGRVSQSRVLELEVGILSAFDFNLPFKTSILNHISLYMGFHEETPGLTKEQQLCLDIVLLIAELSLTDYKSLNFSMQNLAHSSIWIAVSLLSVAYSGPVKFLPSLNRRSAEPEWCNVVAFLLQNVDAEMKSAVSIIPRLKSLGRWANTREAPNVFGVPISTKIPSSLAPHACVTVIEEHKTKTESLALQFLRGTSALAFDLLVAAVLKEGFTQPHRVWTPLPEAQGMAFSHLHHFWNMMKADFPLPPDSCPMSNY